MAIIQNKEKSLENERNSIINKSRLRDIDILKSNRRNIGLLQKFRNFKSKVDWHTLQ